ncbi:hypothetical protein ABPG74_017098 [Tetrahymena malaccensis]
MYQQGQGGLNSNQNGYSNQQHIGQQIGQQMYSNQASGLNSYQIKQQIGQQYSYHPQNNMMSASRQNYAQNQVQMQQSLSSYQVQQSYAQPQVQKIPYSSINMASISPRSQTSPYNQQQQLQQNISLQQQQQNQQVLLQQQAYQQSSALKSPLQNNTNYNNQVINQINSNLPQKNQDYIDSFSGSILDEGISVGGVGGGAKLMPESRQVQGSKSQQNQDIFIGNVQRNIAVPVMNQMNNQHFNQSPFKSSQQPVTQFVSTNNNNNSQQINQYTQQKQQMQQQSSSTQNQQMNDLTQQLNQIRINNLKQKEVQQTSQQETDSSIFKIVNKDTGEVFDIRNFDKEVQRSPKQANTQNNNQINAPNQNQQQNQGNSSQQPQGNSAWTDWWNKKRKINSDLLLHAKINNTNQCLELLDKKLGDMRADVNIKETSNDWTPLHYACQNGNTKLVSQLLYHEATIDSESNIKQTPLIIASIGGYEDVLQLLMTAGADINFQDNNGNTALHHACLNGNKRIVEMLLKKPSLDYKIPNKQNKEPYDLCKDDEIKKVFDNFFVFQKAMQKKNPRVRIFNTNQDNIQQMFTVHNNGQNSNNYFQPNIKQFSSGQDQISNNSTQITAMKQNESKSSFNNSDVDTSNLSDEEKIGPNSFIVHGLIGKGSFGEVYLVEKKDSQQLYAMKVLHKSKIMRHNLTRYALTERNVLSVTKHPFIVRLNFAFQTQDKLFLILKYCPGGDLGEHLQKEKRFSEDRVRNYLAEITLALEHLHKKDVIFRDLKPDNIVLDHEGHAMLTDFGLSKEGVLDHSTGAKSFCGSVAYLAPEMLKRCGHGKAVDWYLLGVVMYELLVGIPPYYANNKEELFNNIEKGHLKLPSFLSNDARSLLKALLQRNPAKRLGSGKGDADEIKAHQFFANINWEEAEQRKLNVPIPNRKIRISTKFDPNVFEPSSFIENGKEYIPGWSFVDQHAEQNNYHKQ